MHLRVEFLQRVVDFDPVIATGLQLQLLILKCFTPGRVVLMLNNVVRTHITLIKPKNKLNCQTLCILYCCYCCCLVLLFFEPTNMSGSTEFCFGWKSSTFGRKYSPLPPTPPLLLSSGCF